MDALFGFIIFVICMVAAGIVGASVTGTRCEDTRKADMQLAQTLIDEQYQRGYTDGVMSKVTPNEIRKALGYGPISEVLTVKEQYEEYKREWCETRGYKLEDVDEKTGINGECYVCFDEWLSNEHAEKKAPYNPVEVAYKLLVAYRDANMIPDMDTIEELIGYLGEALE